MPGDDLTQQLAEAIAAELDGTSVDGSPRWGQPAEQDIRAARAVLASGLVVPTSDVLRFADYMERRTPGNTSSASVNTLFADELRALTQQETP